MNISPLTIYLWQLVDNLRDALIPLLIAGTISSIASTIAYVANAADGNNKLADICKPWMRMTIPITVAIFMFRTLIPTSNTIAMMYVVPRIADSKVVQQDLPDIYNAAVDALKRAIVPDKK